MVPSGFHSIAAHTQLTTVQSKLHESTHCGRAVVMMYLCVSVEWVTLDFVIIPNCRLEARRFCSDSPRLCTAQYLYQYTVECALCHFAVPCTNASVRSEASLFESICS